MNQEIPFEKLVDYVEDRLPEAEAEQIRAAIMENEAVQRTVAWLTSFQELSEQITLQTPPTLVREELQRRFTARQVEQPPTEPVPA